MPPINNSDWTNTGQVSIRGNAWASVTMPNAEPIYDPIQVGVAPGVMWTLDPVSPRDKWNEALPDALGEGNPGELFTIFEYNRSVQVVLPSGATVTVRPFLLQAGNGQLVGNYQSSSSPEKSATCKWTVGAPHGDFDPLIFGKAPVPDQYRDKWDGQWILFSLNLSSSNPGGAELVALIRAGRGFIDQDHATTIGGKATLTCDDSSIRSESDFKPWFFFAFTQVGTTATNAALPTAPLPVTPPPVMPPPVMPPPVTPPPDTPLSKFEFWTRKGPHRIGSRFNLGSDFTFKGKVNLSGKAIAISGHTDADGRNFVEDSRSLADFFVGLVPTISIDSRTSVLDALGDGGDASQNTANFTFWEWPDSIVVMSGNSEFAEVNPFLLGAQNGYFVEADSSGNLSASKTGVGAAVLLGKVPGTQRTAGPGQQEGAVLFAFKLTPGNPGRGEFLGYVQATRVPHRNGNLITTVGGAIHLSLSKFSHQSDPYCFFSWSDAGISLDVIKQNNLRALDSQDFSWVGWPGADFSGFQLDNVDFTGANLTGANLTGAGLRGANFTLANFTGADLTGATFGESATFGNANFMKALIRRCSLIKANFANTNLSGADMTGCDLTEADFRQAEFAFLPLNSGDDSHSLKLNLSDANLQNANFAGRRLSSMRFVGANLGGTDFSRCFLAALQQATLEPAPEFSAAPSFSTDPNNLTKFTGATVMASIIGLNWSCLDLTDAKIIDLPQDLTGLKASHLTAKGIDLSNKNLTNAVFDNADLTNAIFTESDLTGASFKGAKLYGATFSYATLNGADFTGAQLGSTDTNLRSAVLSYANMRDAVFTNANLDGCVLNDVQWYGDNAKADNATFTGAKISDANLSRINLKGATLDDANLAGTILVNADLSGASAIGLAAFTDSHLQGAQFQGAKLNGADFTNAAVALAHGVPLFELDVADATDLDAKRLSSNIKKAFEDKGFSLLDNPTVQVVTPSAEWTVANAASAMPTTGLGSMYETFTILKNTTGGLQVYGSALWVTQVKGAELQSIAVLCARTVLDQEGPDHCTMDDSTVFPSGHNLTEFRSNELTWEKLMTARTPPTPPKCVYTPGSWGCHPPKRPSS